MQTLRVLSDPHLYTDTLTRHFQPTAFLMLVSESEEYGKLFNELLVILEPLMHIPFSFSLDFELRQVHEWYCGGICVRVLYCGGVCVRVGVALWRCMRMVFFSGVVIILALV